jgi:hypothetical protein
MKLSDWARQQGLYHCLAVVSGGEAPCPCPPIAYWDNPSIRPEGTTVLYA